MSKLLDIGVDAGAIDAAVEKVYGALDVEQILDEGIAILLNRTRTNFLRQIDPEGNPWPISHAAVLRSYGAFLSTFGGIGGRRKTKRRSGGGTLFDTGRLFRSIQLAARGPNQRAIMSDTPYGIYHNEGTAKLPKREFMGFSDKDGRIVESLVLKRVVEALQ